MLQLPLLNHEIRTRTHRGQIQVFDTIRKKWLQLTPEEHVRQLLLLHLTESMGYPASLIAIEKGLSFGHTTLRFDLVVYDRRTHLPWLLVECKAPDVIIDTNTLQQLIQYHGKLPDCRYWLITNGAQSFCAEIDDQYKVIWRNSLPPY